MYAFNVGASCLGLRIFEAAAQSPQLIGCSIVRTHQHATGRGG